MKTNKELNQVTEINNDFSIVKLYNAIENSDKVLQENQEDCQSIEQENILNIARHERIQSALEDSNFEKTSYNDIMNSDNRLSYDECFEKGFIEGRKSLFNKKVYILLTVDYDCEMFPIIDEIVAICTTKSILKEAIKQYTETALVAKDLYVLTKHLI